MTDRMPAPNNNYRGGGSGGAKGTIHSQSPPPPIFLELTQLVNLKLHLCYITMRISRNQNIPKQFQSDKTLKWTSLCIGNFEVYFHTFEPSDTSEFGFHVLQKNPLAFFISAFWEVKTNSTFPVANFTFLCCHEVQVNWKCLLQVS